MKAAGSNLGRIFLVTPRCLLVQYSVGPLIKYNSQWLSGLRCLFLHQNYWPMLYCRSQVRISPIGLVSQIYLYSVFTNQKFSHPSFLSYECAVAPPWKKVLYYQRRLVFVALYIYYSMTELGACDNFRNNATMSQSQKIVACRVIANFLNIVALLLSRRNIVANSRQI